MGYQIDRAPAGLSVIVMAKGLYYIEPCNIVG